MSVEEAIEEVREVIARVTDPAVMGRARYREFLDYLASEVEGLRMGLADDERNEAEGGS